MNRKHKVSIGDILLMKGAPKKQKDTRKITKAVILANYITQEYKFRKEERFCHKCIQRLNTEDKNYEFKLRNLKKQMRFYRSKVQSVITQKKVVLSA